MGIFSIIAAYKLKRGRILEKGMFSVGEGGGGKWPFSFGFIKQSDSLFFSCPELVVLLICPEGLPCLVGLQANVNICKKMPKV